MCWPFLCYILSLILTQEKHIESTVFFIIHDGNQYVTSQLRTIWRTVFAEKNAINACDESKK